jgi:hypothetical protein
VAVPPAIDILWHIRGCCATWPPKHGTQRCRRHTTAPDVCDNARGNPQMLIAAAGAGERLNTRVTMPAEHAIGAT